MSDPTGRAVRLAVRAATADVPAGGLVEVAVSGGPDSLALLHATVAVSGAGGWRVGVLTVDHGWRPATAQVCAAVARHALALGCGPVRVLRVSPARPGRGPEDAARTARFAALEAAAARDGAVAVLLGHTLDDQAEQVLLGLARGSGARSLHGMPARRGVHRRPLLGLRRSEVRDALPPDLARPLPWTDPSNADPAYLRARVRTEGLPVLEQVLGPGAVVGLARTADLLRADSAALDGWAAQVLAGLDPDDVDVALLEPLPVAVRTRVLRSLAHRHGATAPTSRQLAALDALVSAWHGQGPVALAGPVRGYRVKTPDGCGRLRFCPAHGPQREARRARMDATALHGDLESVLFTEEQIHARLDEMAKEIDARYADSEVLLVGVLKGAIMVMADLARAISVPVTMDWMAVSSYGSGTQSSGVVRILKDLDTDISGRHVLIVEDIIDSGLTLSWLTANLASRGPASIEVATLLRKPDAAKVDVSVSWVGFEIGTDFVVGYGLDYDERYRHLRDIGVLAPHVYG